MDTMKVYIAGDSTAATYPADKSPMAGWGQMLSLFLDDSVQVQNEAMCGRSSKSFLEEGRLKPITDTIGKGDYLFIQFGHNDQKTNERYTDPASTYPEHLTKYIDAARQAGANPVLLTSVERRHFDERGELKDTHGAYPEAMRKLAAQFEVPLIDAQLLTRRLYQSLGPEKSKQLFTWLQPGEHPNYPDGVEDNTHFNETGAKEVAALIAKEVAELGWPLSSHVKL
ncbi:rhamnogalacturonan acetylesterase [Paenibacillus sp. GD4]|uniref:rhamnogalacturonan acetylesterase n=1 Tax=Paenibacillus sp. GD4 TaxID=3068890 RepID=UPI0027965171|nr:rhamnogalacturonan acetylesterase [Paenibacillus sp. GD4]MDQ1912790.1 rhamnogalacturonan acetylesterase [Paenibacillus sp. GD4]